MIVAALLGIALSLQAAEPPRADGRPQTPNTPIARRIGAPTDSGVTATRADAAPVIDGKDDDAVWRTAPPISEFKQWQPTEGKDPRFKTEAKVAYDGANLYVFVRAFDPHPDSIIRLLERRDSFTPSDMIWLFVDSYHDRRTGYEFAVNAAGVKTDLAVYDGGNEDQAWDAVWEAATRIDSLGWTAEFRIPLSQMRYSRDRSHIFGFTIVRDIYRYSERVTWPMLSQSKPDLMSQLGMLGGMDNLEAPRRIELMPYIVTKSASQITNNVYGQKSNVAVGGDLKHRVASNLTLDATINPDFGQVEADPSVLNLSSYESFFDERRPFFVAGRGLFSFNVNCNAVSCNSETLYYSRRIGRTPELAGIYGDTVPLQPTTILGAAKLIGKSAHGATVGVLDAMTERTTSPGDTTFEPRTNFAVVRATQDFRSGNSAIGGMFTAVNRSLDSWSSPYLAKNAYVGALDFRHRLYQNNYEVAGSLDHSRVNGTAAVINSTQTDGVHNYRRPDADLPLDPNRTSLSGDAEELRFGKIGGQHLLFETDYQRRSPGFEINDLGFLRRADQVSWNTWVGFFDRHERKYYNRFQFNNNWSQYWTTAGLPLEAAYYTNFHITLKNNWGWDQGFTIGQLGTTYDDRSARGGPAVRQDPYFAPWVSINGNDRRAIVPYLNANYFKGEGGRNSSWNLSPEVDYKFMGRFSSALTLSLSHNIADNQWYGNFDEAGLTRYTFAHLDQTTTAVTARLNYTFTPDMSLQAYVQPFVSKGTYSNVRQLSATPRADKYDDRYEPFNDLSVTSNPGGFNFKAFQSNIVYRWEYNPGSTLFVVWNEGRQGYSSLEGDKSFSGDVRDLFRLHPANTFLVKVSYWLNR
jgi:hypothetical protein